MGASISPQNTMADWSDSLYYYVRGRIKAANATRKFGGIVQAQDWPLPETQLGAFYMLTSVTEPVAGGSWSGPMYSEQFQWAWQLMGTDVQNNVDANNRGDRYRLHSQMKQELLHGLFPGFTPLCTYSVDISNPQNPVVRGTPFVPTEVIRFSKPKFSDRIDTATGVLFGSGLMTVSGFAPAIYS